MITAFIPIIVQPRRKCSHCREYVGYTETHCHRCGTILTQPDRAPTAVVVALALAFAIGSAALLLAGS